MTNNEARTTGKTILLLEQDKLIARLFILALKSAGFHSIAVSSLEEAKNILKTGDVDGVIVDLAIPVTDAVAFLRWLRVEERQSTPVLTFVANFAPEVAKDLTTSGADVVLRTPVNLSGLLAALRKCGLG